MKGTRCWWLMAGFAIILAAAWIAGCGGVSPPESEAVARGKAAPAPPSFHPDNENCAACHQTIYADWRKSRHAQAWKNDLFRVASENYTKTECLTCHAPDLILRTGLLKEPELRRDSRETGVNCITCHQDATADDWQMHGPYDADSPAHDSTKDAAFQTSESCASCHGQTSDFNQYHPWKESMYGQSAFPCQACHMVPSQGLLADTETDKPVRWVGDHSFPAAYDDEIVKTAAKMTARVSDGQIIVQIENQAGHFLPGGAYRTVVLRATVAGTDLGVVEFGTKTHTQIESGHVVEHRFDLPPGQTSGTARVTLTFYRDVLGEDGETIQREQDGVLMQEASLELSQTSSS